MENEDTETMEDIFIKLTEDNQEVIKLVAKGMELAQKERK